MTTGEPTGTPTSPSCCEPVDPRDGALKAPNTRVQPTPYTGAVRLVPTEDPVIFIGVQRTLRRLNVKTFDNEYPARGSADVKLVAHWKWK